MSPASKEHTAAETHPTGSVVLLSLYLLMLAFFILLNSISQQRTDRADLAMGSVSATFSARLDTETRPNTGGTEVGFHTASDRMFNDVRRLFEQAMPVARFLPKQPAGTMQIELPTTAMFRPGDVNPRPRIVPLLDGIAAGLTQDAPGWRFEVELMLGTGPQLPRGEELDQVLEIRRAGGIAQALRRQGVPEAAIRTGLAPGDVGIMRIAFHARETGSAKVSLDEAVQP